MACILEYSGSVAVAHGPSCLTRDQTHVPCETISHRLRLEPMCWDSNSAKTQFGLEPTWLGLPSRVWLVQVLVTWVRVPSKVLGGFQVARGEGNGNPLQYSCLKNSTDRGAWWTIVHGLTKSRTRLSNFTLTFTKRQARCYLDPV